MESLSVTHKHFTESFTLGILSEIILPLHLCEAVKGSGIDKIFENSTVDSSRRHALHKIVGRLIWTVGITFFNNSLDYTLSNTLYGCETETDITLRVHTELHEALIDIRTEHLDVHTLTFVHKACELIDIRTVACQDCRHVFRRIVGLKPGSLECYPGVACGVTLVEGIGCELLPVVPYLCQHLRVMTVGLPSLHKQCLKLVHLIYELLSHCLAQRVALSSGEVGKQSRQEHDLLLIHSHTISIL